MRVKKIITKKDICILTIRWSVKGATSRFAHLLRRSDVLITELTRVFDFLSAGSLIANLELSFSKLSYDVMLQLEEAFYINKSLENMKIEWTLVNFTNGTSFA